MTQIYPHLVFIGPPGAGKGTQSKLLSENLNHVHLSTGDLLREEIAKDSDLGKRVKDVMASGGLVSDSLILELLKKNLNLKDNRYIFDGYPRNLVQAKALVDSVLSVYSFAAVYFKIDLEILSLRLTNRLTCSGCGAIFGEKILPKKSGICDFCGGTLVKREDDKKEVVTQRLAVYQESSLPMIEYFKSLNKLIVVDAMASPEELYQEIERKVQKIV